MLLCWCGPVVGGHGLNQAQRLGLNQAQRLLLCAISVPGATPAVCAFAAPSVEADNTAEAGDEAVGSHLVHVAAFDGSFYSVAFDPSSADSACAAVVESKFLSLGGDDG